MKYYKDKSSQEYKHRVHDRGRDEMGVVYVSALSAGAYTATLSVMVI
jgi:hypothetical protein